MSQGTCVRCALECVVSTGRALEAVRLPGAALGCRCLHPVSPKKRSLELAQQPRLYKCLGMYAWPMSRLYSARGWAQAGQGVQAPLGSHCAQTHWNSCHRLSCSSLQFSPMTETIPSWPPVAAHPGLPERPDQPGHPRSQRPLSDPDQITSHRGQRNFPRSH